MQRFCLMTDDDDDASEKNYIKILCAVGCY